MVNSQAKGKAAERAVALALTRSGLPSKRHVRTGDRYTHDEGDLRLTVAPVTIEVKNWAKGYTRGEVAELLSKLERQKRRDDIGLLVCKRTGVADPYGWDCWVNPTDGMWLLLGTSVKVIPMAGPSMCTVFEHPVCFVFGDVIRALVSGGWVAELTNPFQNREIS
jgi:hypothetical protein